MSSVSSVQQSIQQTSHKGGTEHPKDDNNNHKKLKATPQASPIISPTWSFPRTPVTPHSAIPKPVPTIPHSSQTLVGLPQITTSLRHAHRTMGLRLLIAILNHASPLAQLKILVAALTAASGASLWLRGQQVDCLSLSGLGYLLVFDALGALHTIFIEPRPSDCIDRVWDALGRKDGPSNIKLPFGRARLPTLSLFSQALFLLFSAIYVCKEAVEHVLMTHPHSSEGAGGSHLGHSERHQSEMEVSCSLVGSALALVLFSALVTTNHNSLSQISAGLVGRPAVTPAILNPFSTLTLGFGILIMGAACFISPNQSGKADGLIAILMVFVITKLVWPVLELTAQVLLQTAPVGSHGGREVTELERRLSDLQNDPQRAAVLKSHLIRVDAPKLWRLTVAPHAPLVCTLSLEASPTSSAVDRLRLSEAVRAALTPLNLELSLHVYEGHRPSLASLRPKSLSACGHSHSHGHGHSHSHDDDDDDDGHSDSHSHHHSHSHSHDHSHSHSHDHSHSHSHDDSHSHSHDHGHRHGGSQSAEAGDSQSRSHDPTAPHPRHPSGVTLDTQPVEEILEASQEVKDQDKKHVLLSPRPDASFNGPSDSDSDDHLSSSLDHSPHVVQYHHHPHLPLSN